MSRPAKSRPSGKREVDDYRHDEAQRLNNPEAGLARYETEKPPTKRYEYDPHMDPQLVWTGKAERASFEVDAVSIHVHERLSTEAIVKTLRKEQPQLALFGDPELDRDREVEFYQHEVDWTNRLILGDSLVVMTSLLERERMAGQVQCIYFDPPYGINYNSNFQARISNRSPRENDAGLRRSCVMSVSSEADPEGDMGSAWLNRPGMPGDARLVRASLDLSVWGAAAEAGSQPCPTFAYRFVEPVGLPSADGPGDRTERKRGCCWRALSQLVCIRSSIRGAETRGIEPGAAAWAGQGSASASGSPRLGRWRSGRRSL